MASHWKSSCRARSLTGCNPEMKPVTKKYEKLKTLLKNYFSSTSQI